MNEWGELLTPTTVVGVLVIGGILLYMWRKDASNPAQTASYSVINASAEYSGSVFKVAQDAMKMAEEAMASQRRCERRNIHLVRYNRTLQNQLVAAGIMPADPPADLLAD